MKHCMGSKYIKVLRTLGFILALIEGGICLCGSVYVLSEEQSALAIVISVLLALIGIALLSYGTFVWIVETRKYSVDESGITICYCNLFKRFYAWTEFKGAVVCDISHASKFPQNCSLVIRFSNFDEPCGPFSVNRRCKRPGLDYWRGDWYTLFRFRKIIYVEFSPENLDEIRKFSKLWVIYSITEYGRELYDHNMERWKWEKMKKEEN